MIVLLLCLLLFIANLMYECFWSQINNILSYNTNQIIIPTMEDMLQSQIHESCKLALPNGLKELMSDISREVLRAQPHDLLQFITDYLAALLVTREHLYIAVQVCGNVCECPCRPELDDELRSIGLDEEDAKEAADIINSFLGQGNGKEQDLILKLIKSTALNADNLPDIVAAIRRAYLRHQSNKAHAHYESPSPPSSDDDQTTKAIKHTLALYKKTDPGYQIYNIMASRIQAAYRAYKVRRLVSIEVKSLRGSKSMERSRVRFDTIADEIGRGEKESEHELKEEPDKVISESSIKRLSSTSLAGSYIKLPEHRPYSIQDLEESFEESDEEKPEKERNNFFYTREESEDEISISTYNTDNQELFYSRPVEEVIEEIESVDDSDVEEVTELIEDNLNAGDAEDALKE